MTYIQYEEHNFSAKRTLLLNTANRIIEEYSEQGYTLTLRQLYYQMVARDIIPNTERSYKNLGTAITDGRMAGVISWSAIEDRGRGIKGWLIEEDEQTVLYGIEYGLALDMWSRQGVYVEVWVEKDALSSVIRKPCERFRTPYMACKGYLSASEAWRAGQRFDDALSRGMRCVIIHLGDHDPSGLDMTRDNDERMTTFTWGTGVEMRRIALNMDQVEQYNPPSNPAKMTDTRAEEYVARHGYSSWELDALEPRVLDDLVTRELRSLIDIDIWNDAQNEERERRERLARFHERYDDIVEWLDDTE